MTRKNPLLTIAISKGRLQKETLRRLAAAGIEPPDGVDDRSRDAGDTTEMAEQIQTGALTGEDGSSRSVQRGQTRIRLDGRPVGDGRTDLHRAVEQSEDREARVQPGNGPAGAGHDASRCRPVGVEQRVRRQIADFAEVLPQGPSQHVVDRVDGGRRRIGHGLDGS